MSLVADYASSSEELDEEQLQAAASGDEPKSKRMKLPAADFDAENDFNYAEEEEVKSIPKNFGRTMANKPRGGKGGGKGKGKGKGKGGSKKKGDTSCTTKYPDPSQYKVGCLTSLLTSCSSCSLSCSLSCSPTFDLQIGCFTESTANAKFQEVVALSSGGGTPGKPTGSPQCWNPMICINECGRLGFKYAGVYSKVARVTAGYHASCSCAHAHSLTRRWAGILIQRGQPVPVAPPARIVTRTRHAQPF
jgi:hypothetical protein